METLPRWEGFIPIFCMHSVDTVRAGGFSRGWLGKIGSRGRDHCRLVIPLDGSLGVKSKGIPPKMAETIRFGWAILAPVTLIQAKDL